MCAKTGSAEQRLAVGVFWRGFLCFKVVVGPAISSQHGHKDIEKQVLRFQEIRRGIFYNTRPDNSAGQLTQFWKLSVSPRPELVHRGAFRPLDQVSVRIQLCLSSYFLDLYISWLIPSCIGLTVVYFWHRTTHPKSTPTHFSLAAESRPAVVGRVHFWFISGGCRLVGVLTRLL